MANWGDLANTKVGDVKPPSLLPAGHYIALVTGMAEIIESKQKKTPGIVFPIKLQEPSADVDSDEFALVENFSSRENDKLTFWVSPNSLFRFTDFGKALIGAKAEDMTIVELAEAIATSNEPFLIEASHEPNDRDPERPRLRLDNPAPLSAQG